MAVVRCETLSREPYAGGVEFGEAGAYERLDARLHFAVDPSNPANQKIVDLALAPRDERGRVQFSADFCLLRPADPSRGNRRLFLEVPNRGRKLLSGQLNRAAGGLIPTRDIPPGDGFLYRHGYAVGWIGWQWDVVRSEALMGLDAPLAMDGGRHIAGQTVLRFQPSVAHHTHLLADRVHHPYPAADVDEAGAALTVRDFDDDAPRVIPRDRWRFAREEGGEVVPDGEHFWLADGFEPGKIYELVYTTAHAPVVGCGLLAIRDVASFLKHDVTADNPLAGALDLAYGFGVSQDGRLLRHFLWLGLNLDEEGRQVFDGLMPHVGGARRGEFNHRFGQPSVQYTPGFGHLAPFDDASLLARQRALGGCPKVIQTNSSAEYWRGDCALMHVSQDGTADLPADLETRIYHLAGTQHGPGTLPLGCESVADGAKGRHWFNTLDYTPLLRAALVNLDRWVSAGVAPPANAHPRLADRSLVTRAAALDSMPDIPGFRLPDPEKILRIRRVDLGERASEGIGRFPAVEGERYPSLVSAVDADGNEVGGIRLPDLTVPVSTLTGWNPRAPETGGEDLIIPMQGITVFFHRTRAEREAAGDPRPSLEERYPTRDDFLARVREAAAALAGQRYVLDEDIDVIVANAAERYDYAMRGEPIMPAL
ncbi:MAG TPA: alpha/beta hydrolase domain-containing protein [Thermomicrobiales bacterium]|nr:alpha/beta hydrolase domain-containing protein [Thermomicrobiales bacterium]